MACSPLPRGDVAETERQDKHTWRFYFLAVPCHGAMSLKRRLKTLHHIQ